MDIVSASPPAPAATQLHKIQVDPSAAPTLTRLFSKYVQSFLRRVGGQLEGHSPNHSVSEGVYNAGWKASPPQSTCANCTNNLCGAQLQVCWVEGAEGDRSLSSWRVCPLGL